jgi:hypothetical protein
VEIQEVFMPGKGTSVFKVRYLTTLSVAKFIQRR